MLLEFSSTVAALDCALAIQDLVGLINQGVPDDDKMLLRIGINVGDVIVRGGDVFGEVVNVASRLEAIAEPGGICVSNACYIQTKRVQSSRIRAVSGGGAPRLSVGRRAAVC